MPFSFDTTLRIKNRSSYQTFSVIDKRQSKDNIGFVLRGPFRRKIYVKTNAPFDKALEKAVRVILKDSVCSLDTVLFVLYDFNLEMLPQDKLIGFFYLRGQFFQGRNDRYNFVMDVDSIFEVGRRDVPEALIRLAQTKVIECLDMVAHSAPDTTHEYSLNQATHFIENKKKSYPIFQTCNFRKGIYKTVTDFLTHTPTGEAFMQYDHFIENTNYPFFYLMDENGKKGKLIQSVFAICNGEKWYRPAAGGWKPIKWDGAEFRTRLVAKGLIIASNESEDGQGPCQYEARFDPEKGKFVPVKRLFE